MKDKDTDKRLQRVYGITLTEYNSLLEKQGGGCAICGSLPKSRRLHVDHDHKWKKVKLTVFMAGIDVFSATANYRGREYTAGGHTKQEARHNVRQLLKRASVRGILCFPCNRGIRVFFDDPDRLHGAAFYLEAFKYGKPIG